MNLQITMASKIVCQDNFLNELQLKAKERTEFEVEL